MCVQLVYLGMLNVALRSVSDGTERLTPLPNFKRGTPGMTTVP